jgi:hypothetical protein
VLITALGSLETPLPCGHRVTEMVELCESHIEHVSLRLVSCESNTWPGDVTNTENGLRFGLD